ncbi:hypothetical protein FB567DRAFT_188826 [Paraphoma chrysanthemicola]|uniref:Uncharacterized protein n=1 Tax=Paraphoma chrysanthemicola TaxID=798071 RepID=A0A8K0VT12_9PLEO|nr:hypothetical protein FB567DRAFT_188826 [Paraphoma chrysanthemicola]
MHPGVVPCKADRSQPTMSIIKSPRPHMKCTSLNTDHSPLPPEAGSRFCQASRTAVVSASWPSRHVAVGSSDVFDKESLPYLLALYGRLCHGLSSELTQLRADSAQSLGERHFDLQPALDPTEQLLPRTPGEFLLSRRRTFEPHYEAVRSRWFSRRERGKNKQETGGERKVMKELRKGRTFGRRGLLRLVRGATSRRRWTYNCLSHLHFSPPLLRYCRSVTFARSATREARTISSPEGAISSSFGAVDDREIHLKDCSRWHYPGHTTGR